MADGDKVWRRRILRRSGQLPIAIGGNRSSRVKAELTLAQIEGAYAGERCPVCRESLLITNRRDFKEKTSITLRCPNKCYSAQRWVKIDSAVPNGG